MTDKEKAKAYDEAINKIKPLYEQAKRDDNPIWSTYEYLIPQLAESDERIRRTLVEYFGPKVQLDFVRGVPIQKIRDWLEKQKDLDKMIVVSPEVWDNAISDAYENGKKDGEKQKEPHYANKRVDDIMNMPELSAFEQALTNFIGYWEDDEEHWPSQFVKKHGKHILDMAREELQKEQKPEQYSPLCVTVKDKIHEYIAKHFIPDTVVKTDVKSIVKAMEEGVRLGKEEQKSVNLPAGFYVTLPDGKKYYTKEMRCNGINVKVVGPKPAEWSEKYIADVFEKVGLAKIVREQGNDALTNAVQSAMLELSKVESTEWSEEDKKIMNEIITIMDGGKVTSGTYLSEYAAFLKSLRPSWKPSEEMKQNYIRKDALLEWIQEARAIPHENAIVRDLAFQEVINKLKSM